MDYLDPVRKKARIRRLYLGYFLTTVAIGLATLILVYIGSGYAPSEDGLIQNGLLYIDSTPRDATITLNGQRQRSGTDARLVVPGATYDIRLSKDGYRPWTRTIQLEDGKVRRLSYPRLYPVSLKTNIVQTEAVAPDLASGSLDRRFILLHFPNNLLRFRLVSTERPYDPATELNLPAELVNSPEKTAIYSAVEWTEDGRFVVVQRTLEGSNEFLLFDWENPSQVRNLTRELSLTADSQLTMRDRASNRYVVFTPSAGTVRYIDLANPSGAEVVAENVVQQVSFEQDKVLFVTPHPEAADKVRVRLVEGDRTYEIKDLQKSDFYFLEMAKFGRNLVVLTGSPAEQKASVFRNPTGYLRANSDKTFPLATATLKVDKPEFASFSGDASTVVLYGDGQFSSHEFEADRSYSYKVNLPYSKTIELRWMDGSRLNIVSEDSVYSFDFDGSNLEKLVAARPQYGVYFDRDYETLYSFLVNKEGNLFQLTATSLNAE